MENKSLLSSSSSSSPFFSSFDTNPLVPAPPPHAAAAAAAAGGDDCEEDACSICLEPFTAQDPATVTSCKHEYHLQCILDWSQRSKECPICWQLLALRDPACQELLTAVETEKRVRSRNVSSAAASNLPHYHEDFDAEQDSYSDDSDFDERIMRHLAVSAGRARYVRRRLTQRYSGRSHSQVIMAGSPANAPGTEQTDTSPEEGQGLSSGSSGGNSLTSTTPIVNLHPMSPGASASTNIASSASVNKDGPFKPRALFRRSPNSSPNEQGSSEISISDSIKSKWLAASARYKESFSKSTRGIKEKLLARNNSVKELSKGVQREMSAGIAGVARMIERLDLTSKRTGSSSPWSYQTGGESNLSLKGKGLLDSIVAPNLDMKAKETAHDINLEAASNLPNTMPGCVEVSHTQGGH